MSEKYHISKGTIKVHDGKALKAGDSVISERLWAKLVGKQTNVDIEKEKNVAKKAKLQEAKLLKSTKISKDDRPKKVKK